AGAGAGAGEINRYNGFGNLGSNMTYPATHSIAAKTARRQKENGRISIRPLYRLVKDSSLDIACQQLLIRSCTAEQQSTG
ncbi:hypothetical protein, partial [Aeromonas hydrophila]|uniref:hypothetical protein n=1 Tax=Aeromonas hydrophila TaxID=644 RepID=UPI0036DD5A4A